LLRSFIKIEIVRMLSVFLEMNSLLHFAGNGNG